MLEIDGLLAEGVTLPAVFYTDPDIARLEDEFIFGPSRQIVGVEPELRNVGDYFTTEIGGFDFTGLNGCLRAVPRSNEGGLPPFEQLGLFPLPVDSWKGYIFVTLKEVEPLSAALGEFPAVLVWCAPCRVLDGQLQLLAVDHPELGVLVVDVDENEMLAQRYEVRSVPTVMLFRDGAVEQVMTGPMTKRLLEIGLGLGPPPATSGA